ncbi:hypothetical protein FXO37_00888 [Capsicum annuum]|nr:hypothetical protein FXO37_00888 [Capsicum annuum]
MPSRLQFVAWDLGYKQVILETDLEYCLHVVIHLISSNHPQAQLIKACNNLVQRDWQCFCKRLAFATAMMGSLNQATAYESPAHSSTGTRSKPWLFPLLGSLRFHVLFHS